MVYAIVHLSSQVYMYLRLKQKLLTTPVTCNMYVAIPTHGSLTTSMSAMMLGPPLRFSKILISRLIFFFFTGCKEGEGGKKD